MSHSKIHPMYLEAARRKGQRGDTVLAHINPEEAQYLQHHFGGDINPHTGLPQFGFFSGITRAIFGKKKTDPVTGEQTRSGLRNIVHNLAPIEKAIRPVVKKVLPIVTSLGGGMIGGPLGSVIGGSLGGALSSKKHRLDHALGGAGIGLATHWLAPKIGNAFGVNPHGGMGKVLGMDNTQTLGSQLSHIFGMDPTHAASNSVPGLSHYHNMGAEQAGSGSGSMFDSIINSIKDNPLNWGLGAAALGGTLMKKSKVPKEPTMAEHVQANPRSWSPADQPQPFKQKRMKYIEPPKGYEPGYSPQHQYFEEEEDPEGKTLYAAKGGYIHGASGGQTDDVKTKIPEGSYIMNATDVSLLGDGNSINGAKKLSEFEDKFLRSGVTKGYMHSHTRTRDIPVYLSQGEYQLSPETVTAIGKGSNNRGAKILDKGRKDLRKQKGVKAILPPKAKNFHSYIR